MRLYRERLSPKRNSSQSGLGAPAVFGDPRLWPARSAGASFRVRSKERIGDGHDLTDRHAPPKIEA